MNTATLNTGIRGFESSKFSDLTTLAGRLLFALLFIPAGLSKFTGFDGTVGYIASVGLPFPELMAAAAAVLELGAGIALLLGWQVRLSALGLAGFTLAASVLFHAYWAAPAEQAYMQQLLFMKNIAVAGGLLILAGTGAGRFSLESGLKKD